MKGVAAFVMGVYAGVIIMNPAVQRMAKESVVNLMNYAKGQVNDNFHKKEASEEDVSYETAESEESLGT